MRKLLLVLACAAGFERRLPQLRSALVGDWLSAVAASSLAAPFITTVDVSIIKATASGSSLVSAASSTLKTGLLKNPLRFWFSFQCRWTMTVYCLTYGASNSVSSFCEIYKRRSEIPTLVGTTTLNSASCVCKDAAFAKRFGADAARAVPPASIALFLLRDVLTMGCAFVLPKPVAAITGRPELAQFLCPIAAQVAVVGPHLLALDLHNRPKQTLANRVNFLKPKAPATLAFRCLRTVPALCAGVIANNYLRDTWRSRTGKVSSSSPPPTAPTPLIPPP